MLVLYEASRKEELLYTTAFVVRREKNDWFSGWIWRCLSVKVRGALISLAEAGKHGLSPLRVSGKLQLRTASGITIGGKYQPTQSRRWRYLPGN